ncbi:MAG: preprotein translocase subunit SecG [Micavibrio sp.]|nr:MAG: preprotein translocase subunit SecG [Micavibrio sp.]
MESVVLVIHLFLALAIIGLVLLQRSEGGGLGIGGGGGGMGGLASAKGTANLLSRATGICAFAFFSTSLLLGILAGTHSRDREGILEGLEAPIIEEVVEGETKAKKAAGTGKVKVGKDGAITIPDVPIAE